MKRFFLGLLFFLTFYSVKSYSFGAIDNWLSYHKKCNKACKFYLEGNYEKALSKYEKTFRKYKPLGDDYRVAGLTAFKLGKNELGISYLKKSIANGIHPLVISSDKDYLVYHEMIMDTMFKIMENSHLSIEYSSYMKEMSLIEEKYQQEMRRMIDSIQPYYSNDSIQEYSNITISPILGAQAKLLTYMIEEVGVPPLNHIEARCIHIYMLHTPLCYYEEWIKVLEKSLKKNEIAPDWYSKEVEVLHLHLGKDYLYGVVETNIVYDKKRYMKRNKIKIGLSKNDSINKLRFPLL